MKRNNIFSVFCVLLCVLLLTASCTVLPAENNGTGTQETESSTTPTTNAPNTPEDPNNGGQGGNEEAKDTYTVTVMDQDGNGIAGLKIQYCHKATGNCLTPVTANDSGVATFTREKTDSIHNYYITLTGGYAAGTYGHIENKYYFDEGASVLEITLKTYTVKAVKNAAGLKDVEVTLKSGDAIVKVNTLGKAVKTDENGEVKFLLPAGDYSVTVQAPAGSTVDGDATVAFGTDKTVQINFN